MDGFTWGEICRYKYVISQYMQDMDLILSCDIKFYNHWSQIDVFITGTIDACAISGQVNQKLKTAKFSCTILQIFRSYVL